MKGVKIYLLMGLVLILSGCATTSWRGGSTVTTEEGITPKLGELPIASKLRFEDIPVPESFRLDPKTSFVYEDGQIHLGVLHYESRTPPEELVAFFKREMPNYNWNIVNIIEYGDRMLSFEKPGQSCVISILPKGRGSLVTISTAPKRE